MSETIFLTSMETGVSVCLLALEWREVDHVFAQNKDTLTTDVSAFASVGPHLLRE